MFIRSFLFSLIVVFFVAPAQAQYAEEFNITLANNSETEQQAADLLNKILNTYDLGQWVWTKDIFIGDEARPHSHPVLTLSARSWNRESALLATFVHEQFHWYLDENLEAQEKIIAKLRKAYPEVPVGFPNGGRDEYSTYVHLIVCMFEYQAMEKLLWKEQARNSLKKYRHYQWIYEKVLAEDPAIYAAIEKGGLSLPENWFLKSYIFLS